MVQSDGGHALLPRLEAAAQHRDPEIAWRAAGVIAAFYDLKPSSPAPLPWIDMLPATVKDREALIREYRERGHAAGCPSYAPRWEDYRYATSLYVGDLLRSGQGPNLLRLKGLVGLAEDPERPVVVHGVQHVVHAPATLDAWPGPDRTSRLVLILRDGEPAFLRRLWDAFLGRQAVDAPDAAALRDNPLAIPGG